MDTCMYICYACIFVWCIGENGLLNTCNPCVFFIHPPKTRLHTKSQIHIQNRGFQLAERAEERRSMQARVLVRKEEKTMIISLLTQLSSYINVYAAFRWLVALPSWLAGFVSFITVIAVNGSSFGCDSSGEGKEMRR